MQVRTNDQARCENFDIIIFVQQYFQDKEFQSQETTFVMVSNKELRIMQDRGVLVYRFTIFNKSVSVINNLHVINKDFKL